MKENGRESEAVKALARFEFKRCAWRCCSGDVEMLADCESVRSIFVRLGLKSEGGVPPVENGVIGSLFEAPTEEFAE